MAKKQRSGRPRPSPATRRPHAAAPAPALPPRAAYAQVWISGGPVAPWWPAALWLCAFESGFPALHGIFFVGMIFALIAFGAGHRYMKGSWPFWVLAFVLLVAGFVNQVPREIPAAACAGIALYWNWRRRGGRLGGVSIASRLLQAAAAALALLLLTGTGVFTPDELLLLRQLAERSSTAPSLMQSPEQLTTSALRPGDAVHLKGRARCTPSSMLIFDCTELNWRPTSEPVVASADAAPSGDAAADQQRAIALASGLSANSATGIRLTAVGATPARWPNSFLLPRPRSADEEAPSGEELGTRALQRVLAQAGPGEDFEIRGVILRRHLAPTDTQGWYSIDARSGAQVLAEMAWTAGVFVAALLVLCWQVAELVGQGIVAWQGRPKPRR